MELLNKIQRELKVPKGHRNTFANYDYRNAEDILEAVKPLLGDKAVLVLEDEIVQLGERYYVKATAMLMQVDGDKKAFASATGFAREPLEKKGSDASQITGAASSYARKYALCGLFCIDDGKDADGDDNTPTQSAKAFGGNTPGKITGKPTPPKKVADTRTVQKKRIAELADEMSAGPLVSANDYKEAVQKMTGLSLEEGNYAEIITRLEAQKNG